MFSNKVLPTTADTGSFGNAAPQHMFDADSRESRVFCRIKKHDGKAISLSYSQLEVVREAIEHA
jgi:hypothetical protein